MNLVRELRVARAIGSGNYPAAIAVYESALVKNPNDQSSMEFLALCHYWNNKPQNAIVLIERREKYGELEFDMLVLAVKCFSAVEDHKSAYNYACRCKNMPPDVASDFVKNTIFFSALKKPLLHNSQSNWRDLGWVREYKAWCENELGYREY